MTLSFTSHAHLDAKGDILTVGHWIHREVEAVIPVDSYVWLDFASVSEPPNRDDEEVGWYRISRYVYTSDHFCIVAICVGPFKNIERDGY